MRRPRLVSFLLLVSAACGDDGGSAAPDAPAGDAGLDAPAVPGCDYTEQADVTNDDFSGNVANSVAETSGAFTSVPRTICGTIDSTHYVPADELVDIDGYTFTVATAVDVRIDLVAPGGEALEDLTLDVYPDGSLNNVGPSAKFVGDHAVLDVHLAAGSYELLLYAGKPAALPASLPYRVTFRVDTPATRCAKLTGAPSYVETLDTAANNHAANDMVVIANPSLSLTPSTTDIAEPTGLTLGPASAYLVTGSSADIAVTSGYKDRDTFALTTGPTTNELAVRLSWPGTTQDLDFFVLEAGTVPGIGRAIEAVKQEPEFKSFGVKPRSVYWILVGNDAASGGGNVSYGLSICGATFTP
jgi:hypothetical protein